MDYFDYKVLIHSGYHCFSAHSYFPYMKILSFKREILHLHSYAFHTLLYAVLIHCGEKQAACDPDQEIETYVY